VSVYNRAKQLGLGKSEAYWRSLQSGRFTRGREHIGKQFWYAKGHVPANKGLRRPGYAPGRMRETQFKKGVLNGVAAMRFKPIGSTRLCDGYVYRKISAHPGPWTRNWKLEHFLVWERERGPVPPGHCLKFINGDRTDIRLDNLQLITRRENMARNTVHNLPKPLASTIQLLGALKRQIRRRTERGEEQDRRPAQSPVRDARGAKRQGRANGHRPCESRG
jgi:hypothetical protein